MKLNRGLLWKEWKQHWWKCWAAFVLMSTTPIISPAFGYIISRFDPSVSHQFFSVWLKTFLQIAGGDAGRSSLGMMAVWVVLGLGVVLLGEERNQKSLEYLTAMPVSRREIVSAKYLLGAIAIVVIILVNMIVISAAGFLTPGPQLYPAILVWFAVTTSVLLAVFSVAFLAATITGNLVASPIGAITLLSGPQLVLALISGLLTSHGIISGDGGQLIMDVGRTLTLPEYIRTYKYGQTSLMTVPAMLAVAGASFALAVKMFDNNHLERDGRIFMLGISLKPHS